MMLNKINESINQMHVIFRIKNAKKHRLDIKAPIIADSECSNIMPRHYKQTAIDTEQIKSNLLAAHQAEQTMH